MPLSSLSERSAVLAAINEFDKLGRDAFLRKYGFGRARSYMLRHNGRDYDSKAIAGAAHGHQFGAPLHWRDFSGGETTVAAKLEDLGFQVGRPQHAEWHLEVGDITTRTEVKRRYGGTIYGGIEPSRTTPNVLVYTDPDQGAVHGYNYDGWDEGDPENVFYYTGEGPTGNQEFKDGNRALLEHDQTGRTLRLFEAIDKKQRPGGKRQRYLGAFHLDPANPYEFVQAPDSTGNWRRVIVFRMVRDGARPTAGTPRPPGRETLPDTADLSAPSLDSDELTDDSLNTAVPDADVEFVPSENNTVTEYELQPHVGLTARREEGALVASFEAWLRRQSHEVRRVRIRVPREPHELVTDTYDVTDAILYEAKSRADRATIRLAVGQALDYLRFLPGTRGRLLLPAEPSADLKDLISSCGLGLAYRRLGSWIIEP